MPGKRALVTGAAGFIAANLSRRLVADGHLVVLVARPRSNLWRLEGVPARIAEVDLTDTAQVSATMNEVRPQWVFHLAAHGAYSTQMDLSRIVATNLLGTMNVVNAAAAAGVEHVVCAGSSSEYGFKDHPPSEAELPEPNSDYAVTKTAATLFGSYAARRSDFHVTTLRLYSVYGPFEEPSRLIPQLLLHALKGELPPLVDPRTARDFTFVDDVVNAFLLAAAGQGRKDAIYNVGSGHQSDLAEVVELVRELFGVANEPQWGTMEQRSWDTRAWSCDNRQIKSSLGWSPDVDLRTGLVSTMRWLQSDKARFDHYRAMSQSPPRS